MLDTWQDIMGAAETFIPPPQFEMFSTMFWNLHTQPRYPNWNETAVTILEMIAADEILSKRFCRYILSLGVRLSDELYFLTSACELLPHTYYLQVRILTSSLLRDVAADEYARARLWVELSGLVWQNETLKHWLLQLTRVIFPHDDAERYEVLLELRSALDFENVSALIVSATQYRHYMTHLDDHSKIAFLQSVLDSYLGNNYYLMNRYMVFVTGGEVLIGPPGNLLPRQNPALPMNP